jgi:hypothetical protein
VKEKFTDKCGEDTEKRIVLAFESHCSLNLGGSENRVLEATPEHYGQVLQNMRNRAHLNARKRVARASIK